MVLRSVLALVLFVLGAYVITINCWIFYRTMIRRQHAPSVVPILGGIFGVGALLAAPIPVVHAWWWLPLLLDWGGLPGLFTSLIWQFLDGQKQKQKHGG